MSPRPYGQVLAPGLSSTFRPSLRAGFEVALRFLCFTMLNMQLSKLWMYGQGLQTFFGLHKIRKIHVGLAV